jgi:transcription-repair coupling factor (superfamily II helicase)
MEELYRRILEDLLSRGTASLSGLGGSAAAFVTAALARRERRTCLVLTPGATATAAFIRDLDYFFGGGLALPIPAYETLPFEEEAPDEEQAAQRLAALHHLASGRPGIFVAPAALLVQSLPPPAVVRRAAVELGPGQSVDPQVLARSLAAMGYTRVPLVEGPGEFAARGSILDIFSPGWRFPLRLDILGDTVESLKWFDPAGQRSTGTAGSVTVLPATEIIGPELPAVFRRRASEFSPLFGDDDSPLTRVRQELQESGPRPWHTTLLPLFYDEPASLFDYLPDDAMVVLADEAEVLQEARNRLRDLEQRGGEAGYDHAFVRKFAVESAAALLRLEKRSLAPLRVLRLLPGVTEAEGKSIPVDARPTALRLAGGTRPQRGGWPAAETLKEWAAAGKVVIVCHTPGSARRLLDLLADNGLAAHLVEQGPFEPGWLAEADPAPILHVGALREGFRIPGKGIALVSEDDLFGPKRRHHEHRPARTSLFDLDFAALRPGDFLVHEEHGIGVYGGIEQVKVNSHSEEMLSISYADGGRLFIPMDRLFLVQKYIAGEGQHPRLDRLGGKTWSTSKAKAKKAVRGMVRELLRVHARRSLQGGHAFSPDTPWQKEFEAAFDYEETPDQWQAIEDVKRDLESPRPMDRLVCGDVGFGKTEVALRAAFKVAADGRQVAVLAPTTVLSQQHYLNFTRRFAPFPLKVAMLSRFTPPAEVKKTLAGLASGDVDVVIGTHRLIQGDVVFSALGLVIIDEEHRFGVKDKERLKKLTETTDVLTLSATPIPRTFYMAMSGLRDLSVIETPPESRLGIKTRVLQFSGKVIREAITRELARGGQVFFLHNRIKSIFSMARYLSEQVPEARIAVGHGQMSERSLKGVMEDFIAGRADILVSTSIVESGLDIPNANTMIINRADRFGLADLYQLRGRIGRSSHQAYAYMLAPAGRLTAEAQQRLAAIEEFSELGAGVRVAALDLEIRGAGNLLGYEQSGRMAEVGLEMYTRILEEVIAEQKGELAPSIATLHPEVKVPWPAFIPEEYIPDGSQRLSAYKRLSLADDLTRIARIGEELADLFGHHPEPLAVLLGVGRLRVAARRAGVEKVTVAGDAAELHFSRATPVDPRRVLDLIRRSDGGVRLKGDDRLVVMLPPGAPLGRLERLESGLAELADGGGA